MDERPEGAPVSLLEESAGAIPDLFAPTAAPALPTDGRFAGSYQASIAIPDTLLDEVVEYTEAEPASFGSYAAMGKFGSFELRRSDAPNAAAATTWPAAKMIYYAREHHFAPILEEMHIPVIPLKRDFLFSYERVITELGQI